MGKVRNIILLAFLCLIVLTLVNRYHQKQKDPILFRVYQSSYGENVILQFFGIIPKKFKEIYGLEIIEKGEKYTLKKIFRKHQSQIEVGYLLEVNDKEEFIVAFLYHLIRNQDLEGITYENHLNYLFDLETFNTYLKFSKLKDPDEILDKVAFFYSEGVEYEKIDSQEDLNALKKYFDKIYGTIPDPEEYEKKRKTLNFYENNYYWYPRMGLVKFDLNIENGQVTQANSYIVGLMGLNFPPL